MAAAARMESRSAAFVDPRVVDADETAWRGSLEFEALRLAYRGSGGIAYGEDLARLLEARPLADGHSLAKLIAAPE